MSAYPTKEHKKIAEMLKTVGFERMDDWYDNSGCPAPISGHILQFYNPTTKKAMQVSIGDYNDEYMFGEDTVEEIKEKFKVE